MPGPTSANSERARQRERTTQIRLLALIERAATARFSREFNRLARELGAMFREFGALLFLDAAMAEHEKRLTIALNRLYSDAGVVFGSRIRRAVGKSMLGGMRYKQESAQETLFDLAMRQFTEGVSGEKIVDITETTLGQVRKALELIDLEGLGEIPGAKLIEKETGGLIGRKRAARIARTEGHTGSQFASQTQMDQLEVEYFKRWVSVQDARTRDSDDAFNHRSANGQKVPRGEKFKIKKQGGGTELLDYPGDPKGSPGNIINCRCVQVYEVKV